MTHVFIFHGTSGYPDENWFPWIKEKLETLGCKVIVPQFPTPYNQTPKSWFEVFRQYEDVLNEQTIIIGHSLGGTFLLHVLEKSSVQIKAAFLIASPIGILPIKNYATDKPFIDHDFNFEKIKKNCGRFVVFHSNNDPYVSLGNGKKLSEIFKTELTFVPNAGHFNKTSGYVEFELLLNKIKEVLAA